MKRVLSFSLILIVFCITGLLGGSFFMSSLAYAQDTEENVVEIGTAGDLKNYIESYGQDNVQDNIVLTADINISSLVDAEDETADVVFGSIGTEENPFAGTFDGRGYSITNLQIDTRTTEEQTLQSNQYAGLFGYTDGAKIQNVDLSGNVTLFVGGCVSSYVGALVGRAVDTDIQFCQVTARVNLDATFDHNINFGVLAGMVVDSDISYVICRYTATSGLGTWNFDSRTDNIFNFGGVVGVLSNSTLDFAVVSERFFVNVSEDFVGDVSLGGIVGNVVQGGSQIFNVATENSFSITNNALTSVEAIVSVGEVAGVVSNPVPTSGNIAYIHFQNNIGIERFGRMGEYSYANSALYDNMTVANERITSEDYFNNQMWHWQYGSWDFKTTWYFGSGTVNLQSFYGNFNVSLSNSLDNSVLTSETQLQSVYRFGDSVDIEFSFQPLVRDEMTVGDMSKYYSLGSVILSNAQLSSQEIASIVALPGSNGEILTYRISAKNDTNGDFSYFNNLLSITKNEDDNGFVLRILDVNLATTGEYNITTTAKPFEANISTRLYQGENNDELVEGEQPGYVFYAEGTSTTSPEMSLDRMTYGQNYRIETRVRPGTANAFVGWYLVNDDGADILLGNDRVLDFTFGMTANLTDSCEIYAKYCDNACVITFNIGDGNGILGIEVNGTIVEFSPESHGATTVNVSKTESQLSLEIFVDKSYDFNVEQFITDLDVYKAEDPTKTFCSLVESYENNDYKYYSFQLDMTTLTDDFEEAFTITCSATPADNGSSSWIWIVVGCVSGAIVLALLIVLIVWLVRRNRYGGGSSTGTKSFKKKDYKNMYF